MVRLDLRLSTLRVRLGRSVVVQRAALGAACAGLIVAAMPFEAQAQFTNFRGPSYNIGPRVNINPGPHIHYSPQVRYGEQDAPPGGAKRPGKPKKTGDATPGNSRNNPSSGGNRNIIPNEVVIEVDGTPTPEQVDALARRHRLSRIESQSFDLTGTTMFRWRIPDRRSVASVVRELQADAAIKSANPNQRFQLQQAAPSQYALPKMNVPQAHRIAQGEGVIVAVIDSGIDVTHPELAGMVVGTFDALSSDEKPHVHGTGIAGAIGAHARLQGSAPAAQILAVRAFSAKGGSADSSTFNILRSLEYAVSNRARIINMSFAGPDDALLGRALEAIAKKNIVMIAAAGNAGAKSPPLFPASDKNVIAVSASDANDKIFIASNRGRHLAVAAPGVDVLVPAPEGKYQVTSGTSFSAAYVSGVAALMVERKPSIRADEVRAVLMGTARDLGAPGFDTDFGAGLVDALAAVNAVEGKVPVTEVSAGTPR